MEFAIFGLIGVVYFIIGAFAVLKYDKKLNELESELIKTWREEFGMTKEITWTFLMFFFWPIVGPYELLTDFKRWRYPNCLRT